MDAGAAADGVYAARRRAGRRGRSERSAFVCVCGRSGPALRGRKRTHRQRQDVYPQRRPPPDRRVRVRAAPADCGRLGRARRLCRRQPCGRSRRTQADRRAAERLPGAVGRVRFTERRRIAGADALRAARPAGRRHDHSFGDAASASACRRQRRGRFRRFGRDVPAGGLRCCERNVHIVRSRRIGRVVRAGCRLGRRGMGRDRRGRRPVRRRRGPA